MPKTPTPLIQHLRGRAMALAVAGTALALAGLLPATAAATTKAGPVPRAAAPDPVSVLAYTAKERRESLAYWTPARIEAVGKSVGLGSTGPKAKPWRGTALMTIGRLVFVNANGADTWCTATAVKSANRLRLLRHPPAARRGTPALRRYGEEAERPAGHPLRHERRLQRRPVAGRLPHHHRQGHPGLGQQLTGSLTPTQMQGEVLGATAKKVYDRAQHG